ncbi:MULTISPECIES: helicase HerA-like domain-containing protein [Rhodomicrobium]|uniref:helicase HerA-like domain-containing protein n=1 Tax=Rhodomicrobium TaxID=1068 RepID=UPI000B4B5171|nr:MULTISPECIES: helicase HerA-like domain-containing protein [Rhodomicrobium]
MSGPTDDAVFLGASVKPERLLLRLANRHGLITGATGTGKTVSLQIMAEGFSDAGVPVFAADVKGDLAGLAEAGVSKPFLEKRAKEVGLEDYAYRAFPVMFWDLFGEQGHPVRATVEDMGALLLARLMELNDVQEGVLNIAFRVAQDEKLPLIDLKDLRALIGNVSERADELSQKYGNVSKSSVGAIQRRLLVMEQQSAAHFFGEPAFDIADFMRKDSDGRGYISILAADRLMSTPRLYSTFLLWLLNELFRKMPEAGDPDKPKLVFFFDEAHLLFDEAPKALIERIEQIARLIRSKGIGVYFVTQNPLDVPDSVSSQLGNRIQHALRAFTPREQRAVKAAASTFRPNPKFDAERVIMELGVGEALVSTLEPNGEPSIVQRTLIRPPSSRLGPLTPEERRAVIAQSPVKGVYEEALDRSTAYEMLKRRTEASTSADTGEDGFARHGEFRVPKIPGRGEVRDRPARSSGRDTPTDTFLKSLARSVGTVLPRILERVLRKPPRR